MVLTVQQTGRMGRTIRSPQHTFHIRSRPWQIQPFFIAPVLPGETLKNLLMQARVVTDPIKNPLIGWWIEYYFFYVKHRDLDERDTLSSMVLDPEYDTSALNEAADTALYHYGNTIPWTKLCLKRVVEEYFRDEGEAWNDHLIDTLPIAQINQQSWLDSAVNDADLVTAEDLNVDLNANSTITASEVERALRQWQWARANNLTEQSYEDFLATYGVVPEPEELHKPELVRYVREWSYPTNTVDASTGTPSSAVSWAVAERADKDRFFREPGFLFGVTVARPKVYLSKQTGSAVGMLNDAISWLPAVLGDDPMSSLKKFLGDGEDAVADGDGEGPLPYNTDAYWVDVRDLFLYGDQFINFALTETNAGLVALPTIGMQKRYVSATDADALFNGAANKVKQDGVVSLKIAGTQRDHSLHR